MTRPAKLVSLESDSDVLTLAVPADNAPARHRASSFRSSSRSCELSSLTAPVVIQVAQTICAHCKKGVPEDEAICVECGMPRVEELDAQNTEKHKRGLKELIYSSDSSPRQVNRLRHELALCLYRQAMKIRYDTSQHRRVYELLREAHEYNHRSVEIAIKYSWIALLIDEFEEIERHLRKMVLTIDMTPSQRRRCLTNLACMCVNTQNPRYEEAEYFCKQALEIDATPMLYEYLGMALQGQDRIEEAMTAFERALAIDSNRVMAKNSLSALKKQKKNRPPSSSTLPLPDAGEDSIVDMGDVKRRRRRSSLVQRMKDVMKFGGVGKNTHYDEF